jgi:hypothetical protein
LYKRLLDQVKAEPDISISLPHTIPIHGSVKLIYVFEIPQSPRRPHLPSKAEDRFFWNRLGSKCERMTLEEVRYQMNTYEEKREKLALLVMELNHIIRSVSEQASYQGGSHDGTMFRFEIIDRVTVESFSIIKSTPNIIGALDTLKKRLMFLNMEKEKMMGIASHLANAGAHWVAYRRKVESMQPEIVILAEQIQRTLKEELGVETPF